MSESKAGGLAAGMSERVWVPGRARTKGSLKPVHNRTGAGRCRVSLTEDGEYSKAWKNQMIARIREQAVCERYAGPVMVRLGFTFARLAGDADARFPIKHEYGDIDKLERNVLDALTQSGLIKDDALVVHCVANKQFASPGEEPGVWIEVMPL